MSLRIWLPLTGTLENKGCSNLANATVQSGVAVDNNGKLGKCYTNSGSTANAATSISFKSNQFSLCAWVKINTRRNNWCRAFGLAGSGNYMGLACEHTNGTSLGFHFYKTIDGTNTSVFDTYPLNFSTGTWAHFAMAYDGTKFYIYKDGALLTSGNANKTNIEANMNTLYLFGGTSGNYSLCSLNDVRVYDHCLSAAEVHEISQGLVLHYKLDGGINGNENFILASHKITSGGDASGITRTYMTDDSLKVVAASGNGNWCSIGFAKNSNDNVGAKLTVGDTYTISCDVKVEEGTTLPTVFINSGNSYKRLQGTIIQNQWIRAYYTSTWADPGTGYGNISLHLGFSGIVGTYYFKNFKLEKSSFPTVWSPAPADGGVNLTQIQDSSGYGHNGTINDTTLKLVSDTARYSAAIQNSQANNSATFPFKGQVDMPDSSTLTFSWWMKPTTWGLQTSGIFSTSAGDSPTDYSTTAANMRDSCFDCCNTSGTCVRINVASYLTLDEWHHYALTYNGSQLNFYKDGVSKVTASQSGSLKAFKNIFPFYSKAGGVNRCTSGSLSDFRIYATALSVDDILSLYHTAAKVDNLGGLHTYELKETGTVPQVLKKGIVQHDILHEAAALNSGPTVSYKPAANASNSCATGVIVDFSEFADEGQPLTCTLNCDISWSGLAAGTGGTFRVLLQGSNRKKATNSFAWEGANYVTNGYNFTSLITANSTGSTHRIYTFTIPATWFDTYNGSYFGVRTDYANGTGTITISNIKVTIAANSFKIKSNSIQAENLIEF